MPALHNDDARVTDEELRLLLLRTPVGTTAVGDVRFWYRNVFLLALAIFDAVVLLLFPERVFQTFIIPGAPQGLAIYLLMVGWSGVMVTVLYGYSYLLDWDFERVSMICFSIQLAGFVRDFLFIVSLAINIQSTLGVYAVLRLLGISFLFVNMMYAKKAPPMHQRLWPHPGTD